MFSETHWKFGTDEKPLRFLRDFCQVQAECESGPLEISVISGRVSIFAALKMGSIYPQIARHDIGMMTKKWWGCHIVRQTTVLMFQREALWWEGAFWYLEMSCIYHPRPEIGLHKRGESIIEWSKDTARAKWFNKFWRLVFYCSEKHQGLFGLI